MKGKLKEKVIKNFDKRLQQKELESKRKRIWQEIISNHNGSNKELFTHLIREGIKLLKDNSEKQAFQTLEKAILLSPENVPLLIFVAKIFYKSDKLQSAEKHLEKAFELSPHNLKILVLLGAIYAEQGKALQSRKLLSILASQEKTKICANFTWGMLAAKEENWQEAFVAFKEAAEISPTAELKYLAGCACFQLQNYTTAKDFFAESVEADEKFADAWFMLSVIYEITNELTNSEIARQKAFEAKETGAKCLKFMSRRSRVNLETALAFLHLREENKKLLSNGSLRLTRFFKQNIFNVIE